MDSEYRATIPFLLTKHKRRIHEKPVKNHLCPDCGASFSERTQLLQHTKYIHEMITDEKIEEILCFTCGLIIKSKIGLEKHVKQFHGKNINRQPSQNSDLPYKCGSCEKELPTIEIFRSHLREFHKSERPKLDPNKRTKYQYQCSECCLLFSNR